MLGRRAFVIGTLATACGAQSKRVEPAREARRVVATPPLFDAYPALSRSLPYTRLGELPTPVMRAHALGDDAGLSNLWLKRDDVSGVYGGGKVRKLELFLADAMRLGRNRIVSSGAVGSN